MERSGNVNPEGVQHGPYPNEDKYGRICSQGTWHIIAIRKALYDEGRIESIQAEDLEKNLLPLLEEEERQVDLEACPSPIAIIPLGEEMYYQLGC